MTASPLGSAVGARVAGVPPGRYGFGGILRSEWTKLRTVRSTVWTLGLTIAIGIGIAAVATAETRSHWSSMGLVTRLTFDPVGTSLAGALFAQLTVGILGVLVVSAEYGTGTIRATFAAAPRRPLVLVAKVTVFGVTALLVSEIVTFASFTLGQSLLSAPVPHATFATPGAWRAVVGTGLYLCVIGLLALGLAAIIRHTAGAITAFVALLLVLPIVVHALPSSIANAVERYFPDRIGATMIALHHGPHSFAPWTGFGLLCGYAVVALVIGGALVVRRDA